MGVALPKVAVIVELPLTRPVTNPDVAPTVALAVSDEAQVTELVTLAVDPSVNVAVAVN